MLFSGCCEKMSERAVTPSEPFAKKYHLFAFSGCRQVMYYYSASSAINFASLTASAS